MEDVCNGAFIVEKVSPSLRLPVMYPVDLSVCLSRCQSVSRLSAVPGLLGLCRDEGSLWRQSESTGSDIIHQ